MVLKNYAEIVRERIVSESSDSPPYTPVPGFTQNGETVSNEISAPYEVPQFPIEVIEKKLAIQKQLSSRVAKEEDKRSHYEPSLVGTVADENDRLFKLDEHDFVPHYQRVYISGEDTSGVPLEDLQQASRLLVQALHIRECYMEMSHQSFPPLTARFLRSFDNKAPHHYKNIQHEDKKTIADHPVHAPPSTTSPWECDSPPSKGYIFSPLRGVYQVYKDQNALDNNNPLPYTYPHLDLFVQDMNRLCSMIADGPMKSFCYRRLSYLSSKYQLHVLLNELRELASQKAVPHRDFYNIRKVDTHIHAASCMNQKHLLRFIKKTLKNHADEVVTCGREGEMTLRQVFQSMNLTSYDLTVDMLDVHADRNTFHRFDKFNAKYNPIGESRLREVFLKTDNYLGGKYFARIIKVYFYLS